MWSRLAAFLHGRLARAAIIFFVLLCVGVAGRAPAHHHVHSTLGFLIVGAALLVPWAVAERAVAGVGAVCEQRGVPPPRRRALIVGAGEAGTALARDLEEHFPKEYDIIGFVDADTAVLPENGWKILGPPEEIAVLVRQHRVDEVMVASAGLADGREAPDPTADRLPPLLTRDNLGIPVPALASTSYAVWKRFFDVTFSLAALVAAAPAVAVAALAIKLTSPGPVFYDQERVGRGGRRFTIYKLRTMVAGAEDGTGPVLAERRDSRITRVGRALRATKLDEIPQFFNVLRGDMSVIGPRPERPCFVEAYCHHIPAYDERHRVRPGISGLAQVHGGYRTHVYVKLRYDLIYVSRQSFWLDLQIVARTLRAIAQNLNGEY
jgi:lipopolysaccharide/colanic/teichoic acid biosynthesis glycosyltransferase